MNLSIIWVQEWRAEIEEPQREAAKTAYEELLLDGQFKVFCAEILRIKGTEKMKFLFMSELTEQGVKNVFEKFLSKGISIKLKSEQYKQVVKND